MDATVLIKGSKGNLEEYNVLRSFWNPRLLPWFSTAWLILDIRWIQHG